MSEWQCEVCNFQGQPSNLKKVKDEWGYDYYCECPHCESEYTNDCVSNRADGEVCAFCGEFVEEVVEVNNGGSQSDKICLMCKECE